MARPAAVTPNRHIHTTLPAELMSRLELILFSEVEGRIPQGAIQGFLIDRIREYLDHRSLDLAPFIPGTQPGTAIVRGHPLTLAALTNYLGGSHATQD